MSPRITGGAFAASAITAVFAGLPAGTAAACNRMDGCIHDAQIESYRMMHDGAMSEAMRSGAANIEAFRQMQSGAQPDVPQPGPSEPRRKRH